MAKAAKLKFPVKAGLRLRAQPPRPRGRPRTTDLQELEERLLSTARQTFVRKGYGAASMNAIAKLASVSKNTLYARFPSKAALFRAIVDQQIASAQAELFPAYARAEVPVEQQLRDYLNVALRSSVSRDVLEINRLIISESLQFPELGEAALARFQIGAQHIARLLEITAARARRPCRDSANAARMLLLQANGWYSFILTSNRVVTDRQRTTWVANAVSFFMASRGSW